MHHDSTVELYQLDVHSYSEEFCLAYDIPSPVSREDEHEAEFLEDYYEELRRETTEEDSRSPRSSGEEQDFDPLVGPVAAWTPELRWIVAAHGCAPSLEMLERGLVLLRSMCCDAVALAGRLKAKTAEFFQLEARINRVNEITYGWWYELVGIAQLGVFEAMKCARDVLRAELYSKPEYRQLMRTRDKARDEERLLNPVEKTKKAERDRRLQKTSARRAADAARKRDATPEQKAAEAQRKRAARAAKKENKR